MKSVVMVVASAGLAWGGLAGNALAQDDAASSQTYRIMIASGLKAAGEAEFVAGPLTFGKVFLRQKLTYARTGVLSIALTLSNKDESIIIPAQSPMYAIKPMWSYQGTVIWCTIPMGTTPEVCLFHNSGKSIWTRATDATYTGSVDVPVGNDAAPEPIVEERALDQDFGISVDYGLSDPKAKDKPIPLQNGQGYIMDFGPPPALGISFTYYHDGDVKLTGRQDYPKVQDVIVSVAGSKDILIHKDASSKRFIGSVVE